MNCAKCGHHDCQTQPKYQYLECNKAGRASAIYWQICPNCDRLTIYLKESSDANDVLGGSKDFDVMTIVYPK